MKDHKENFHASTPCRLINPCKSEIGKISKQILEGINNDLLAKLNINQWRDTGQDIDWFKKLECKRKSKFIQVDIKECYPSITEETLDKAISFALNDTAVTLEDIRIIKHSQKSFLFHLEQAWKKKESSSCFDVTMASYDGAELCELIGIFTQLVLQDIRNKEAMDLYRDDGFKVLNKVSSQNTDKIRKKIIHVFQDNGFSIDIVTNLVEINVLDVTFNLRNGSYQPYKKPNDELKYINVLSNHPPQILKQLTITISDRLSRNSSSELIFNESKHQYENASRKSGFKSKLTYRDSTAPTNKKMISRKRKFTWFNPPYNQNVSTNIAKILLKLVDKHFPRTHRLQEIFNRNTKEVSYSYMSDAQQLIKKHNNFIKNNKNKTTLSCNCRDKNGCPLNRSCNCRDKNGCPLNRNGKTENINYKCTSLMKSSVEKVYLGVSEGECKKNRYYNH